jgi:hypothetical protein
MEVSGEQLRVRWDDGHETSIVPGPGALRIVANRPSRG